MLHNNEGLLPLAETNKYTIMQIACVGHIFKCKHVCKLKPALFRSWHFYLFTFWFNTLLAWCVCMSWFEFCPPCSPSDLRQHCLILRFCWRLPYHYASHGNPQFAHICVARWRHICATNQVKFAFILWFMQKNRSGLGNLTKAHTTVHCDYVYFKR